MGIKIATIAPEISNFFSDVENARIISTRLSWGGVDNSIFELDNQTGTEKDFDLLVIGTPNDNDITEFKNKLSPFRKQIETALIDKIPVLALGLGWLLLGDKISYADGTKISGLGILPIEAYEQKRKVDEIICYRKNSLMFGFCNTNLSVSGVTEPLVNIVYGPGNEEGSFKEGQVYRSLYGTGIQGPICAKNPDFADEIIKLVCKRKQLEYIKTDKSRFADESAELAKKQILQKLKLKI